MEGWKSEVKNQEPRARIQELEVTRLWIQFLKKKINYFIKD